MGVTYTTTSAATYVPIATYTVPSATASYTFSSIPSTYTDLVIVTNISTSTASDMLFRLNGDTGSNYSQTYLSGDGTNSSSGRYTNLTTGYLDHNAVTSSTNFNYDCIININNYSNATTYKTILSRANNSATGVDASVLLWRSTAAITSIIIYPSGSATLSTGTTLTLYGILGA